MKIINKAFNLKTKGNPDLLDITDRLVDILRESKIMKGSLTVFVVGSTCGITTFEYEPGLVKDMQELYEKIIPEDKHYHHDDTWGDANGFSHLRASLTGQSMVVPFENGELLLGRWQQVVLAEFDNRPRERKIIVQITGE
jgi:secondary thiamine-phosphate synthase enzyme